MNRILAVLAMLATSAMPVMTLAATVSINFESGYVDDQVVDDEFLLDSNGDRSFVRIQTAGSNTMSVEATGPDAGTGQTNGFLFDTDGVFDTVSPNATDSLGNYFLRTTQAISGSLNAINVFSFVFGGGASDVEGQLWDIDGNTNQGTEQWDVVATLTGGATQTIRSPRGTNTGDDGISGATSTSPGTAGLDGLPWTFSFSMAGNQIERIDFNFTGSKTRGIGAAFEGLVVTQAAPVPLPATAWMLIAAVGGLGVARRFRKA